MTDGQKTLIKELCENSTVRINLLTVPGYTPYCGKTHCHHGMPRTTFDSNVGQFTCKCGWRSNYPEKFMLAYRTFRIGSQVCSKCGTTVFNKKSKYCGDGSDKDNAHRWTHINHAG